MGKKSFHGLGWEGGGRDQHLLFAKKHPYLGTSEKFLKMEELREREGYLGKGEASGEWETARNLRSSGKESKNQRKGLDEK